MLPVNCQQCTDGSRSPCWSYLNENMDLLRAGCDSNLRKQIANATKYGIPVVVCVNKFASDTDAEIELVKEKAKEYGAVGVKSEHWASGGAGAVELAKATIDACEKPSEFNFLYPLSDDLATKMTKICKEMYGGDGVELSETAKREIEIYEKQGFGNLPICMAKQIGRSSARSSKTITMADYDGCLAAGRSDCGSRCPGDGELGVWAESSAALRGTSESRRKWSSAGRGGC